MLSFPKFSLQLVTFYLEWNKNDAVNSENIHSTVYSNVHTESKDI